MPVTWWCELAWLPPGRLSRGVALTVDDGRFSEVREGVVAPPPGAARLRGLVIPGMANVHSHAFHRALRARTQRERGTFWTWRQQMYATAERLTPDSYLALARATYAEMALAGITSVGEFHYLHHAPGGAVYDDANAMGEALCEAARQAGVRLTLLDTCYLHGGVGQPLEGPQLRFGDGDTARWTDRVDALKPDATIRIGAAIHSSRALRPEEMADVAAWAGDRAAPLHVHLSEQRAENEACLAAYGRTPTGLLADAGALGSRTVAVHATHLTGDDVRLLGGSSTGVCMCPTTERDLADGIGPARQLFTAGSPVSLGSDSHAVIDLFEEARAVELDERLRTEERGHWSAQELLDAATVAGQAAVGWQDSGRLVVGALADFVAVDLASVRTAGATEAKAVEAVAFAATAADVRTVVVGGRTVVEAGRHVLVPDVGAELVAATEALR
jgi:formiminoglutamate deiminase